jgi:hypothetical protein
VAVNSVVKDLHGARSAVTVVKATSNETQWLIFIVSSEGESSLNHRVEWSERE